MTFAATCMELEIITLNEVSQREKDKYHMTSLIYGILENNANEPIYRLTDIENSLKIDSQT